MELNVGYKFPAGKGGEGMIGSETSMGRPQENGFGNRMKFGSNGMRQANKT